MFSGGCSRPRQFCQVIVGICVVMMLGALAPAIGQSPSPTQTLPQPTLLPSATTAQIPLTTAYNALNVPSLAAGMWYRDPTTQVKIYKLTSATYPTASPYWGHDYAEGGDEVSLPYNGTTRAVLVRQNGASGGPWWLIDFTPGVGVSNPRQLIPPLAPWIELSFTFSNNPATPYYAYVSNGSAIHRIDIRTMTEVPGGGWPVSDPSAMWMHQSENDGFFVWMRGANGPTIVGYEPSTGTLKTYTDANLNEPRVDRAGRYVGITMNTPSNGIVVWDWLLNSILWSDSGVYPGIPFAHVASLKDRWLGVDWNLSFPDQFSMFTPAVPYSGVDIGGPANGTLIHGNGNWIQNPTDLNDQWALLTHYGSLEPTGAAWLAPGGMVLITANGQRRLLGHPYNTSATYSYFSFPKFSSDGAYVLFTSDMNGSGRSDIFLAELPSSGSTDTTPPTVALTAPANGATVSGTAVTVAATATDNVGVVGVQFQLDGGNLGSEVTTAPYAIVWNSTLAVIGTHTLTAVAWDAAGNRATSAPITVTVAVVAAAGGGGDLTPPSVSLTTPVAGSTVAGTVTVSASATDNVGVVGVQFKLDGVNLGAAVPVAPYVVSWTTTTATNGAHTLTAVAWDAAGNTATAPAVSVTVANTSTSSGGSANSTGLVGYWAFDDGTGPTATDSSGKGDAGTLVNGSTWTLGQLGQALAFDGLTSYVNIPSTAALNAYPLTVAVWMKTTSATGVRGIVNKYVAGSYNGYQVFLNNGNLCAWYLRDTADYVYDGSGCPFNLPGYADGRWHHIVYVVDASGGRLYVDGMQKGSLPWTGTAGAPTTGQPVHVADYPGAFGGAEYFPGILDDVRIYNRTLSATDVLALYNTQSVQNVIWTNLVNVTVAGNSLQKTSGCDGCADAGATSQQYILSGDGYVEFTVADATLIRYVGLSTGSPGTNPAEIAFAIKVTQGWAEVREHDIYQANTPIAVGDVLRVAVETGVVKYYKNGTVFYTSAATPTYPLLVDTSLLNLTATVTNAVIAGGS